MNEKEVIEQKIEFKQKHLKISQTQRKVYQTCLKNLKENELLVVQDFTKFNNIEGI